MDYDKLLNDWADEIYILMDKARDIRDTSEFGSIKFYVNDGYINGLAEALATLNKVEKKYQKKEKVNR